MLACKGIFMIAFKRALKFSLEKFGENDSFRFAFSKPTLALYFSCDN